MPARRPICLALLLILPYATLQAAPWTLGKGMEAWGGVSLAIQGPRMFTATTEGIFRSEDQGATWRRFGSGIPDSVNTTRFHAAGAALFASTANDGLFRSGDSGKTWQPLVLPALVTDSYFGAVLEKGSTLYAGVGRGVLQSGDGGLTWSLTGIGTNFFNWFNSLAAAGDAVFAGTESKGVFVLRKDEGILKPFPDTMMTGGRIRALAGIAGNLFAATDRCGVCKTADSGKTWTQVLAPEWSGRKIRPVHMIAVGKSLYLATDSLGVFSSEDAGATWAPSGTGFARVARVRDVQAGEGGLYAMAGNGLFRSKDGGKSWKKSQEGLPTGLSSLSLQPLGNLTFAAMRLNSGVPGYLFRSADTGRTWEESGDSIPGTGKIWGVYRIGGDLVADVDSLGIFRSRDLGVTWTFTGTGLPKGKGTIIREVVETDSFAFAAVSPSGVYRSKDKGLTWESANAGMPANVSVQSMLVAGGNVYVGSWMDGLYRSSDNGTSWNLVPSDMGSRSIYAMASAGGALYAGTNNAGAFRSLSNGASWSRFNVSAPFDDIWSMAGDGNRLFAGTVDAGVQLSDQGSAWVTIGTELPGSIILNLAIQGGYLLAAPNGEGVWRMALSDLPSAAAQRDMKGFGVQLPSRFFYGGRVGFGRAGESGVDAAGRLLPRLP